MKDIDDNIGLCFRLNYKGHWYTDPVYQVTKNWTKLKHKSYTEVGDAECIGILTDHGNSYLILQAYTGRSKGYYCWRKLESVTPIPALELLARCAE